MRLTVTSSPHIRSSATTSKLMFSVVLALLPALAAGVYFFGVRALGVTLVCVLSAVVSELLANLLLRRGFTVDDGSAVVTGMLLALTLPASVPYWTAAVGSVFAIVIAKALCGGLGQNVFNPALAARAFLMLLWPAYLTRYAAPGAELSVLEGSVDIVTSATPLHHMAMPALPEESILQMFLGQHGGTIGEVSALALIIGGIFLVVTKVISPRIPLAYLGTVAVIALVFPKTDSALAWAAYSVLAGGVMIGAIFMASDYATSPVSAKGQIVYGIGCGAFTMLFRYFGIYPEGVTYAILLMNACVWAIDRYTPPTRFGTRKGGKV